MKHIYSLNEFVSMSHCKLDTKYTDAIGLKLTPALIDFYNYVYRCAVDMEETREFNFVESVVNRFVSKYIRETFPGMPKVLDHERFEAYKRLHRSDHYYRGVESDRFADNLKHIKQQFVGHSFDWTGTWMTDSEEFASNYTEESNPVPLMNMALLSGAKLDSDDTCESRFEEIMDKLEDLNDANLSENEVSMLDACIYHVLTTCFVKTFVAVGLGFDGIDFEDRGYRAVVVFNKEKLIIEK